MKFGEFVASLHTIHIPTSFGQFILILVFNGVQVLSFSKSDCLDFIANDKRLQFT